MWSKQSGRGRNPRSSNGLQRCVWIPTCCCTTRFSIWKRLLHPLEIPIGLCLFLCVSFVFRRFVGIFVQMKRPIPVDRCVRKNRRRRPSPQQQLLRLENHPPQPHPVPTRTIPTQQLRREAPCNDEPSMPFDPAIPLVRLRTMVPSGMETRTMKTTMTQRIWTRAPPTIHPNPTTTMTFVPLVIPIFWHSPPCDKN